MAKVIINKETVNLGIYRGQPLHLTMEAYRVDYGEFIEFKIVASCPFDKTWILCPDDGTHPFSLLNESDFDDNEYSTMGGVVADNEFIRMTLKQICDVNKTSWSHTGPQDVVKVLIKALVDLWD